MSIKKQENERSETFNGHATTVLKPGRMIGFGALSLITGLYCADLCAVALLHFIGAASLARFASSTIFIVGIAVVSLSWEIWRLNQAQRVCSDSNCLSSHSMLLMAAFLVTVFVVDVGL